MEGLGLLKHYTEQRPKWKAESSKKRPAFYTICFGLTVGICPNTCPV
jgi:hypothetical protein